MEGLTNGASQRQRPAANHTAPNPNQPTVRQQNAPYLNHDQQDLLLAALNAQANGQQGSQANNTLNFQKHETDSETQLTMNDNGLFMSPAQAHLDNSVGDFTPDLDYLDNDFDFENADLGGEMIGALPGGELHDKRKNPDEDDDEEEGDAKRQEGEKGSKKPGRKPLTSEPTTKRKAQNRAAQRAFRERKEKHLKDLETKVTDLTKTHDADKQENGLLKAQIERLQIELREYRKRLSLNGGTGAGRSPPPGASNQTRSSSNSLSGSNNFNFDFPKFGALPGSQIFGNQGLSNGSSPITNRSSNTPPAPSPTTNGTSFSNGSQQQFSRENTQARSMSPKNITGGTTTGSPTNIADFTSPTFNSFSTANNMHGFASTLPQMGPSPNDPFGDLFSPSVLKSASIDSTGNYFQNNAQQLNGNNLSQFNDTNGGESTAGLNRVFQFNSNSSTSDSTSPSASSASQWNANNNTSSCDTSPEPSHDSPATKVKDGETFCDKIRPGSNAQKQTLSQAFSNNTDNNKNYLDPNTAMPSMDSFDPVLFGDYRENNDGGLGGGDFTGGFFDEALNPQGFDFGSPSNLFGILDSPQQQHTNLGVSNSGATNAATPSRSLMAEVEKTCQGGDDDYGLPGSKSQKQQGNVFTGDGNMISCNNIWNQLQSNPDFQEGKFDLDGLCSELRTKARCSESGVMVDQDHVDAALKKLGKKDEKTGKTNPAPHTLMFEQQSWDNVLKKLGGNRSL